MGLSRIGSNSITDAAIATGDLANGAVSNTKLATGSVENYFGTQGLTIGKNRIINGDMRINQRVWSGNAVEFGYTLDRWIAFTGGSNLWSISQNAGSVAPPAGFTNYLGVTSLAATTPEVGHRNLVCQMIEGYNISDWAWGYSSAKPVTLSFWVRSSLTGTFGASINSTGQNTCATFSYTINQANTWEYKTITVAGPTSNPLYWNTDNGRGLWLFFDMGTGTNFAANSTWTSGTKYTIGDSRVNVIGTNGATWYITGVQLEVGSVATPFERRPYGTEFALCQRYYQKSYNYATAPGTGVQADSCLQCIWGVSTNGGIASACFNLPVTMRAGPTVQFWDTEGNASRVTTMDGNANQTPNVTINTQNTTTTRHFIRMYTNGNWGINWMYALSAEL